MRLICAEELDKILSATKPKRVKYTFPTTHFKTEYPAGLCGGDDILKKNLQQIKEIALANLDITDSSKIKSINFELINGKGFAAFVKYENKDIYISSFPVIKAFTVEDSLNAWLWFFFENLKGAINYHKKHSA